VIVAPARRGEDDQRQSRPGDFAGPASPHYASSYPARAVAPSGYAIRR